MQSWKALLSTVLLTAFHSLVGAQNVCTVTSSYELQAGLANAACQILELRDNITLTADSFSASALNLVDQQVTITSDTTAKYGTVLNFGTYTPASSIGVTGNSSITLRGLLVQNFLATIVQNGSTTTFLPIFSFDTSSALYTDNIQFLLDAGRCQQSQNFSAFLAQPRTAWLQSLGSNDFRGGNMIEGVFYVQHAVAPITYTRMNISVTEPGANSALMTLDSCTFTCPSAIETTDQYQVVARIWSPLELLASINLQDSRLILFQQNLTTANGSWGQAPVLIANARQVLIVGEADATSSDDTVALLGAATPEPAFTWIINDNTDLLQLGYGGALTLQSLALQLPEPCCVMITLVGSWFFSNQPLPWNIFGTILPGAFSVQAVRVPQLNAPAYFTMQNVSISYDTCNTDFAAAAQLLVSTTTADTEDAGGNRLSFDGNDTLYCQSCVFQGSQQIPSVYSGAVSVVSLYDTKISCLGSRIASAPSGDDTAAGQSSAAPHLPSLHSSAAGWAPPIWLPVLLAAVCCTFVALGLYAVWRHVSKDRQSFTNLQEVDNVLSPSEEPRVLSPAERAYSALMLAKNALARDNHG